MRIKSSEPSMVMKALETVSAFDFFLCPVFKQVRLHRVEEIPKARSLNGLYGILLKLA
jgi:hypothetical protein